MAVAAGIVGDARMCAELAALDMAAERGGAADLDRRHHAALGEAQMVRVGGAPSGAVAAEDVRHLKTAAVTSPARQAGGVASKFKSSSGL